jgi:hypothetical protein
LLGLDFEGLESLFEAPNPGFGFGLVEIALGIPVDQAGNALAQFGDLLVEQRCVGLARSRLNRFQPALILGYVQDTCKKLSLTYKKLIKNGFLKKFPKLIKI